MIKHLDHLVLTVRDVDVSCKFYVNVLGMKKIVFGDERIALEFGNQKINLHELGKELDPKAAAPQPGSADLCFVVDLPLDVAFQKVVSSGIEIIEGIVPRTGAMGEMQSFYIRDPDNNLVELSSYSHAT